MTSEAKNSPKALLSRMAVAAVGLPVVGVAIHAGGIWIILLLSLTTAVAAYECNRIIGRTTGEHLLTEPDKALARDRHNSNLMALSLALLVGLGNAVAAADDGDMWVMVSSGWVGLAMLGYLLIGDNGAKLRWLYICLWAQLFVWLNLAALELALTDCCSGSAGAWRYLNPLLGLLIVIWSSDTGAYTTGNILKGPKLAPGISRNKTWAGFFGGLALAAAVGAVVLPPTFALSTTAAVVAGAIISLLAQIGDLAESAFKRRYDVKDSSRLLGAHGGVLDRLDSIILPVFAGWFMLVF